VRSKVKKETGQVPWELSSLEGDFYFVPVKGKTVTDSEESSVSATATTADRDENRKIESMQRLDEDQKKVTAEEVKKKFEERKAQIGTVEDELKKLKLQMEVGWKNKEDMKQKEDEYQQKFKAYKKLVQDANDELAIMESNLDVEKKGATLAMSKPPTAPPVTETGRDGRFIAYSDGTVLDTKTKLMWAVKDNGSKINWSDAKSYCENYRGGGYTDWRMPTQDELAGLYDSSKSYKTTDQPSYDVHLTGLIQLSHYFIWAFEKRSSRAAPFEFIKGRREKSHRPGYVTDRYRALPVRSAK
jgi:hypothetical protein